MINWTRGAESVVEGLRLVFAGAAGGVGTQIVATKGNLVIELAAFFALVAMTAIVEYGLRGLEAEI
jgi:hypothetical protein